MTLMLTSFFPGSFPASIAGELTRTITDRDRLAFIASGFSGAYERTDRYYAEILEKFHEIGITFAKTQVIDGRMTPGEARKVVAAADVVWLAGGPTLLQHASLAEYGLGPVLRQHAGVLIGMSAGAINLAATAITTAGDGALTIYEGVGVSPYTVQPHFEPEDLTQELLVLSQTHTLHCICDDAMIVCHDGDIRCYGGVYRLEKGRLTRLSRGEVVPKR